MKGARALLKKTSSPDKADELGVMSKGKGHGRGDTSVKDRGRTKSSTGVRTCF